MGGSTAAPSHVHATSARRLAHYRKGPDDLLPSRLAWFMAHSGGTAVEVITPLVLLFTVSFLPSMRQYAGNWASATWAMAPGVEQRLEELRSPAKGQVQQLQEAMKLDAAAAEMTMQITLGWRSMHSQGRGLYSLLLTHLDDIERYTVRDGEFASNVILGWNFGDGHLHDERLIAAIQRRLNFAPGEFIVAFVESQPVHRRTQDYRVIDAALGVVERGTWRVTDAVAEQPWLPNGPIPLTMTWRHPAYVPKQLHRGATA